MIHWDSILVYAVRYALGRSSYAVLDVVDAVRSSREELPPQTAAVIARDIDRFLRERTDAEWMSEWLALFDDLLTWFPATAEEVERDRRVFS